MVHRRQVEVDGQVETLIFGVHGALWGNAMTWWDHSTGSIWTQPFGEALVGPREGQTVELLTSQFTTWGAWRDANPNTLALNEPSGPSGFNLREFWLVVDFSDEAKAYPVTSVQNEGVINDVVAGVEIAVYSDPEFPDRWTVFSRRFGDGIVELEISPEGVLRDRSSGTTFDPVRGVALDGPFVGTPLGRLPAITSFPGDYETFWPDGEVWRP